MIIHFLKGSAVPTMLDRAARLPGYYPSTWTVECGGNRRQKAAVGGLHARCATADVTTSINGRWNVMMIRRGDDELYLGGTMQLVVFPDTGISTTVRRLRFAGCSGNPSVFGWP